MEKLIANDNPELLGLESQDANFIELPVDALELVGGGVIVLDF